MRFPLTLRRTFILPQSGLFAQDVVSSLFCRLCRLPIKAMDGLKHVDAVMGEMANGQWLMGIQFISHQSQNRSTLPAKGGTTCSSISACCGGRRRGSSARPCDLQAELRRYPTRVRCLLHEPRDRLCSRYRAALIVPWMRSLSSSPTVSPPANLLVEIVPSAEELETSDCDALCLTAAISSGIMRL